ncbi:MAG TPA: adenylate/guanylate cyclase domain-containing protein, partial [Anaerolineae bacterium]|nr:adenylate/guanylate cyclase domain-containing protein [Anaerolineae bacterium]
MYSLQALEEAIVALESHKDALSVDVADLALAALRDKLADLQMAPASRQLAQATILVADLSGFTSMSEFMDAEEVRDTINAVWQKLDGAITSWGGQVDKHVGDAIIALFGV